MNSQIVVLVTGGNRGIGLEICRQLAEMGHKVIMGSRNQMKGEKAASSISGEVIVRKLDVTDERDIRLLAEKLESEIGHIDVLINNAGIIDGRSGSMDGSFDDIRTTIETNLFGSWMMMRYFMPLLKQSSDPRIINISSGMGAWADLTGGYAGYRISKTALNALTVLSSNELAGNIKINSMCPGWVRTDMGGASASRDVEQGADTAVWLATDSQIPDGKFVRDRKVIDW